MRQVRKEPLGSIRAGLSCPCVYLLVCVPDTGLSSVDTAVNRLGLALLGMTFQYGRQTQTDILSVIKKIISVCALRSEGETL